MVSVSFGNVVCVSGVYSTLDVVSMDMDRCANFPQTKRFMYNKLENEGKPFHIMVAKYRPPQSVHWFRHTTAYVMDRRAELRG